EAIEALALYCQIPFGKMHSTNPDVIKLALRLGRTSSSVALKLVNFASLDPEHEKRGVKGMGNVSKLDKDVWNEHYGNWETLSETLVVNQDPEGSQRRLFEATDIVVSHRVRSGQSFFRRAVLAAYNLQCCITRIKSPALLHASHIVP